jgi:two-component system, LytTR family, sensor kinase
MLIPFNQVIGGMTRLFKKDRLIAYSVITLGFLVHWIRDDIQSPSGEFWTSLRNNCWQVIDVVGLNLLYFEYVLPFVTSRKSNRVVAIVSSIALHLSILAIGLYVWRGLGTFIGIYDSFRSFPTERAALYRAADFSVGSFLVFAVYKLFIDYTQMKYEGQQVRLEKKQAELLFLKSQINPHFLFNTLNNIYSLSQHRPQLVSESVLRLSKILRYLLYETGNEFITIEKEIKTLTDYIDLEKLRYSETVSIDFKYDIDEFSEMIPPLLLIPLVENAFKHGVSQSRGNRFVDVKCMLRKRQLHFIVKNSVSNIAGDGAADSTEVRDNIGLSNLKRRLELLYKNFQLTTEKKDSIFTAAITINLSSHV